MSERRDFFVRFLLVELCRLDMGTSKMVLKYIGKLRIKDHAFLFMVITLPV
jgi:hypothetical protein